MTKAVYQPNYWHYLTGDYLNRAHDKTRKGVKILMAVVIGAVRFAGLYTLFRDTAMPTLTRRIQEMFNYAGQANVSV